MSNPIVIAIQLENSNGIKAGKRRFAIMSREPVVSAEWNDNPQIPCQSDQSWNLTVWQRIEDRGYVAKLEGSGQWSNRGDKGVYVGTGPDAKAALGNAWEDRFEPPEFDHIYDAPPSDLMAACADYDATATVPNVE